MLHAKLLDVAIEHFGRVGLKGVSTRDIANEAGTVMSSITYHFGGKQGLYLACADEIAKQMAQRLAPVFEDITDPAALTREEAIAAMLRIVDRFSAIMIDRDTKKWARFLAREQLQPTEAFERIWSNVTAPLLETARKLLAHIHPHLNEDERNAFIIVLLSQAMVPRMAGTLACNVLGVTELGEAEGALLHSLIHRNAQSIFSGATSLTATRLHLREYCC